MSKTSLLPVMVPAPGVVVLPAVVINWPMSRLRAVMTPSKGASMRSNDCSSSSLCTLACADVDLGLASLERRNCIVRVLLRDRILADESLVAIGGHLGQ